MSINHSPKPEKEDITDIIYDGAKLSESKTEKVSQQPVGGSPANDKNGDNEFQYDDIESEEKIELLERLMTVRRTLLSNIESIAKTAKLFQEFNKVFSFEFFQNILKIKPYALADMKSCLDSESLEQTNSYLNYSEMFMHEIYHFWYLRRDLKKTIQKAAEMEDIAMDADSHSNLSQEQSNLQGALKESMRRSSDKVCSRRVVGKKAETFTPAKKRNTKKTFV